MLFFLLERQKRLKTDGFAKMKAPLSELILHISAENISFFLGILQTGVQIRVVSKTSLGDFLCKCPGFSLRYVEKEVQTIFINGKAVDDLQTPLSGRQPVVAISAAMPGLAGAIFRRNGLHASLRTSPGPEPEREERVQGNETIEVTLKLFNTILRDKGEEILRSGVVIASARLVDFLEKRRELLEMIEKASLDAREISVDELLSLVGEEGSLKLRLCTKQPDEL
ncbi:MAG: hypothetical protein CSA20_02075 [Deltaproteobacteria bacterium]|nr:MAG: hypothetical protein CSA20_02075 [Deltaproteobacteria bacterium]